VARLFNARTSADLTPLVDWIRSSRSRFGEVTQSTVERRSSEWTTLFQTVFLRSYAGRSMACLYLIGHASAVLTFVFPIRLDKSQVRRRISHEHDCWAASVFCGFSLPPNPPGRSPLSCSPTPAPRSCSFSARSSSGCGFSVLLWLPCCDSCLRQRKPPAAALSGLLLASIIMPVVLCPSHSAHCPGSTGIGRCNGVAAHVFHRY
jgi:hypothetical protein